MAIKAGQILHVGNGDLVIDRIQSGGVTGINVNEERIEELGNYNTVGTVRDIPDLTFEVESFDMKTELEQLLTGRDGTAGDGTLMDFTTETAPIDIISPYKASGAFNVIRGVALPFLTLESMSYNFSLNDAASQSATMRGDSVYYVPGSVFRETFAGNDSTTVFSYAETALKSTISGTDHYVLGATITVDATGVVSRQFPVTHFTDSTTQITMLTAPATGETLAIVYGSAAASTYSAGVASQGTLTLDTNPTDADTMTVDAKTYTFEDTLTDVDGNIHIGATTADTIANLRGAFSLNTGEAGTDYAASMTAHPTVTISAFTGDDGILTAKTVGTAGDSIVTTETFTAGTNIFDAATLGTTTAGVDSVHIGTGTPPSVRGRNVKVSVSGTDWLGVQSASAEWRVTLERDEEFGNDQVVAQDFDTPEVSGTLTLKSANATALFDNIQTAAGISGTDIANATEDPPALNLVIKIEDPDTGTTLKTLEIPDAKFQMPALQGQVGNKLEADFAFTSVAGQLNVYVADKP